MQSKSKGNLEVVEIKAFVPAKDFELSKRFYRDLGFSMKSDGGGVAYFSVGNCSFLLQDYFVISFAENLQMHLLVEDVKAWWAQVNSAELVSRYGVRLHPLVEQPWGMTDFSIVDPSGVCWRIGQNTPGFVAIGRVDPDVLN